MVSHDQGQQKASATAPLVIVVIDDDDAVRESTRLLLEARGYVVQDHPSAKNFLGSSFTETMLLLVDHHMPDMTGTELLELLHARFQKVIALMMTGRADPMIEARCSRIGVKLLRKPVEEEYLVASIEETYRAGMRS